MPNAFRWVSIYSNQEAAYWHIESCCELAIKYSTSFGGHLAYVPQNSGSQFVAASDNETVGGVDPVCQAMARDWLGHGWPCFYTWSTQSVLITPWMNPDIRFDEAFWWDCQNKWCGKLQWIKSHPQPRYVLLPYIRGEDLSKSLQIPLLQVLAFPLNNSWNLKIFATFINSTTHVILHAPDNSSLRGFNSPSFECQLLLQVFRSHVVAMYLQQVVFVFGRVWYLEVVTPSLHHTWVLKSFNAKQEMFVLQHLWHMFMKMGLYLSLNIVLPGRASPENGRLSEGPLLRFSFELVRCSVKQHWANHADITCCKNANNITHTCEPCASILYTCHISRIFVLYIIYVLDTRITNVINDSYYMIVQYMMSLSS